VERCLHKILDVAVWSQSSCSAIANELKGAAIPQGPRVEDGGVRELGEVHLCGVTLSTVTGSAYFQRKNENRGKRQNAKKQHRHPKKNDKTMWGQSAAVLTCTLGPILEGPDVCAGSPQKASGGANCEIDPQLSRRKATSGEAKS
jgi:hypothetical protein